MGLIPSVIVAVNEALPSERHPVVGQIGRAPLAYAGSPGSDVPFGLRHSVRAGFGEGPQTLLGARRASFAAGRAGDPWPQTLA